MKARLDRPIGRREFLAGSIGSLVAAGAGACVPSSARTGASRWSPDRKVLFVCVDGFGPEYLRESEMPNLEEMIRTGTHVDGTGIVPSLTNVNNVRS